MNVSFSTLRKTIQTLRNVAEQQSQEDNQSFEENSEFLEENESREESPLNQLEMIFEEENPLSFLDTDSNDFDQVAEEYQENQEESQEEPLPDFNFERSHLLEWRRVRRKFSRIPQSLFTKGKGTSVRGIRAHDSDLRLNRPTVLLPALYRENGVSLHMGYEALNFDLVHIRPWTYHDLYGIKYEEENLFFPEFDQKIIITPINDDLNKILQKYIRTLLGENASLLLNRKWFRLDTTLSVLSEENGVSYLRSYLMIVDEQTVQSLDETIQMIHRMQLDWSDLREEEKKNRVRDYMEQVYKTQTLFFLLPLAMGIVPEARRSARTFLVFDPVSKEGSLNREFKETKGFYLPGAMTIMTHLEGKPIQREQAILGEKLTGKDLLNFLQDMKEDLEDEILSIDLKEDDFDFEIVSKEVRKRRYVKDWADESIFYQVESRIPFWRENTIRFISKRIPETFVLTSTSSLFIGKQMMIREQLVREGQFRVDRYFILDKGVFSAKAEFIAGQKVMLICNSTSLILSGRLINKNHPSQDMQKAFEYFDVNVIQADNVWECIITNWQSTTELIVSVSHTSRHLSQGGRVYYGETLGQYIVIDRNGISQVGIIPKKILRKVQEEGRKKGISFEEININLFLETREEYIFIWSEYRAIVSKKGEIRITRTMLLSKNLYLVRFITGAIGNLTVSDQILPSYDIHNSYQEQELESQEFRTRNFRQPKLGDRVLNQGSYHSVLPFHF